MGCAFVLSGGGSLGSVQVGMLLALGEHGITPDLVFGTSVGAVNAAWVAANPGLEGARRLADIWRSVSRRDVFPVRPLAGLRGFLGLADHLVPAANLRSLLEAHLTYANLEDAPIPVSVVTTEITTGAEVLLSEGDAVDAVAASAAIPGVFPPVMVGDRALVDGGVANNTPISYAVEAGAGPIYVLPTGYACALPGAPRGALANVLQSITLLVQQRLIADVVRYQDRADLHVVPSLCPLDVSPLDFSHTGDLIVRAREATNRWLDRGSRPDDQTELLSLHRHLPDGRVVAADAATVTGPNWGLSGG